MKLSVDDIIKLISTAGDMVSHVTDIVNSVKNELSETDAQKVMAAANALKAQNDAFEQQVLAELG